MKPYAPTRITFAVETVHSESAPVPDPDGREPVPVSGTVFNRLSAFFENLAVEINGSLHGERRRGAIRQAIRARLESAGLADFDVVVNTSRPEGNYWVLADGTRIHVTTGGGVAYEAMAGGTARRLDVAVCSNPQSA